MINLMPVSEGAMLKLNNGAVAQVVENIGDGQWVSVKYIAHPNASLIGDEELCHGSDINSVIENAS